MIIRIFILILLLLTGNNVFSDAELVDGGWGDYAPMAFNDLNRPQAIYDSTVNKTFIVYQNRDFNIYAIEYSHDTGKWGYPVYVGAGITIPLSTPDTHGAPAIGVDSGGYLHIFGASHNSTMKHWKSNAIHSISNWTAQSAIGTSATYPFMVTFKNKLYVFYREGTTTNADWVYVTEDNYASPTTVLDNGTDSAYMGGICADSNYLYITWTWYVSGNGYRDDPAFAKFDGENWYQADGSSQTVPITQENDDMIVSTAGTFANVYDVKVDSTGNPYVLIAKSDTSAYIHSGDFLVGVYDAGWATYAISEINNAFDTGSFDVINTTTIDAYLTVDGIDNGTDYTRGGHVKRYRSTDNGQNWTLQETISGTTYQCNSPYVLCNYNSDLKLVWCYGNSAPCWIEGYPTDVKMKAVGSFQNCILNGVN